MAFSIGGTCRFDRSYSESGRNYLILERSYIGVPTAVYAIPWIGNLDTQLVIPQPFSGRCCTITGVRNNQDLIWCGETGMYMGFWVPRGF